MAVYTKLSNEQIEDIFKGYSLDKIERIAEIPEGILNTNYLVEGDNRKYIFRISKCLKWSTRCYSTDVNSNS